MGFKFGHDGGRDGASSDHALWKGEVEQTTKQGLPILGSAMARCGNCGTSTPLSGRPGTTLKDFRCRSCKGINLCNGGLGFTFWSMN